MESTIARAGVKVHLEYDWVGVKFDGAKSVNHSSETFLISSHSTFLYYDSLHNWHEVPLGGEGTTVNPAGIRAPSRSRLSPA